MKYRRKPPKARARKAVAKPAPAKTEEKKEGEEHEEHADSGDHKEAAHK